MTISELICRLQAIKCKHGDLKVRIVGNGVDYGEIKRVGTLASIEGLEDETEDEWQATVAP